MGEAGHARRAFQFARSFPPMTDKLMADQLKQWKELAALILKKRRRSRIGWKSRHIRDLCGLACYGL
jgi:hypothetical protein